jgi:putative intracellular protease/amidase
MAAKKVLVIVSDANSFPVHKANETISQPSGFFLMELAKPLQKLLDNGYEVTFASPEGEEPQADPNSESLLAFLGNYQEKKRENTLIERMKRENGLDHPRRFADIKDEDLDGVAGIFLPGGHAPLTDLGDNPELGRILWHFHKRAKPTATICHGPYALLSTKYIGEGKFAYEGYKIASWSDTEEKFMEILIRGEIEKVESSLRDAGADMQNGLSEMAGHITVDREVVSGGNPLAANVLGDQFLAMLKAKGLGF